MRSLSGAVGLRIVVLIVTFATSVLIARGLGPEGRGTYQVLLTVALLAASLGGLSGELGFAHLFAKHPADRTRILAGAAYGSIVWGAPVALATVGLVTLFSSSTGTGMADLAFLACYTVLVLSTIWSQRALFLQGQPVRAAVVALVEASTAFIAIVVATVMSDLSLQVVLTAVALSSALSTGLSLVWVDARPRNFSARVLRRALAVGLRFHVGQCALQLLMRLDVLLLSAMAGLASVGIYSVAVSLTAPLGVFATTVSTSFLREQFDGVDREAHGATVQLVVVTTMLVVPAAVGLALLAMPLVPIIWGDEFSTARSPLLLLIPGVVALAVQRPVGNYFVRMGHARILNARSVGATALNVLLCLVLIPLWGVNGAALASSVAYMVYAAISLHFWVRMDHLQWSELRDAFRKASSTARQGLRVRST